MKWNLHQFMDEKNVTRIDKWLWAVRIFKTRSLSTEACGGGKIKIDKKTVKPSRMIRPGDIIQARKGIVKYEYKVLNIAEKRMGEAFYQDRLKEITLGRFGTPRDIAEAVVFLASDESSYLAGESININGGLI